MRQETVLVPGARDVEATLDAPEAGDAAACVVACPPHPQHGGHRGDPRLTSVSEYLTEREATESPPNERAMQPRARDVACLRFDYGAWDEGYGEREDARNAIRWAADRYGRVGVFGYSFGGAIAALAAASVDISDRAALAAVSLLAPVSRLDSDLDAAAAIDEIDVPLQVIDGERDTTADWEPLVERARASDRTSEHEVVERSADHFFVGQHGKIAVHVGRFLISHLCAKQ